MTTREKTPAEEVPIPHDRFGEYIVVTETGNRFKHNAKLLATAVNKNEEYVRLAFLDSNDKLVALYEPQCWVMVIDAQQTTEDECRNVWFAATIGVQFANEEPQQTVCSVAAAQIFGRLYQEYMRVNEQLQAMLIGETEARSNAKSQ